MDRRVFLASAVTAAAGMTLSEKADALEQAMSKELDRKISTPWMCNIGAVGERIRSNHEEMPKNDGRTMMGDDPRLPKLPKAPTLEDFFKYRFAPAGHLLQSAYLAVKHDMPEKVVMACLLHDVSYSALLRSDHGYW